LKAADLRPGWASDLVVFADGGQVLERDDCLVLRTPGNPTHYWGNCLIVPQALADADLAHWLGRFHAEITQRQPASCHVAIGVNAPWRGERLPAWEAAGFTLFDNAVMALAPGALREMQPPRGRVEVRPIRWPDEVGAVVELECADTHGLAVEPYRTYRLRKFETYARLHERGLAEWFGLWCDGTLAADCGLIRHAAQPGASGRFQRVATHPAWRRRGLARALVHAVSRHGLEQWQLARVLMIANPREVAIGLYRSLGYAEFDTEWGVERIPAADRAA
jgi:GNAT superfamily N-acetyltransferase